MVTLFPTPSDVRRSPAFRQPPRRAVRNAVAPRAGTYATMHGMDTTAQTKHDLAEAFWRLNAQKDIERISVRELTELAGYNRGTFYLHFDNIYDLRRAAEDKLLASVADCAQYCRANMGKVELMALMGRFLNLYRKNCTQLVVLLGPHGDARFTTELKRLMKDMPLWRVSDPALQIPAGERELLLEQTVAGVLFLITEWLEDPHGVSATRLLHLIYDSAIKR
jgi:AcrR family transcriptional regulator